MSALSATSNDSLFESPFGYSANEAEINSWQLATIPSILRFTNIDIFGSAKDQLRNGNNKPYSPFNDYFGLAGKIKSFGNAIEALAEKDQVHPIHRMEESDILRLKSTWQSNSIYHNMKQTLDRDCVFRLDEGGTGYVEPLSNGIWNNNDTDSSTHTSPLTPSQTFSSFTHIERDMRLNASIQHHVVSMLQAEELMRINSKQHAIGHTGSIGDEDSLSEGSSNGICSGRGIMSSAVSAAIVNAVSNMNGSDDGKLQRHRRVKLCVFCRNNGEPDTVYKTHILKDQSGKVTCPVLRAYTCPTCGASGDDAHTLKYCPATQPTIIYSPGIPDNGVKW